MAKANRLHSTPRQTAPENQPVKIEKDQQFAEAYRETESSVNEIANMAGVNSSLMEATASNPTGAKIHKGFTLVSDQEMYQLLFSAYHLEQMIVAFKKQYYVKYHDGGKAVA
jgi:hypothetical protein